MRQVLLAFQFLTIMPVRVHGKITEEDVASSAAFFPLVGAFQGLLTAASAWLLMRAFPPDIAAGLALALLIVSNGGFDLDGLADTADALAVKSSGNTEADRARRLSVMKDSASGAMGVIALIMTLLLKYVLMRRLLSDFTPPAACAAFFLMPVYSKWVTVPAMYHGGPARNDGLGKMFIDHTGPGSVIISTSLVVFLSLVVSLAGIAGASVTKAIGSCVIFITGFYLFGYLAVKFLMRRFGGLTGDHFGALTEISEVIFLLAGYLWLQHSTL
jgi:adenosylcobinamide-GDP ribazoletransferase